MLKKLIPFAIVLLVIIAFIAGIQIGGLTKPGSCSSAGTIHVNSIPPIPEPRFSGRVVITKTDSDGTHQAELTDVKDIASLLLGSAKKVSLPSADSDKPKGVDTYYTVEFFGLPSKHEQDDSLLKAFVYQKDGAVLLNVPQRGVWTVDENVMEKLGGLVKHQ